LKLILFDAGNTLVWVDHPFLVTLLAGRGYRVSENEILAAEYVAKEVLDGMIRGGNGGTDASRVPIYFGEVLRVLGVTGEDAPALVERVLERHARRNMWCRVRPGTEEALRELRGRGHRLGVISNSDGRIESILHGAGLAAHLDFIIDSQVVGLEKPDPRIFHLGCERGAVEPGEAVYVGDIYEIDVVGASAAGLRAVLVDPLDRWQSLGCERIAGVHELPALLNGSGGNGARPGR
jgi:putative hydrolase of the HAD superfamily